ncbi:head-tail joining protein [Magnetococcus sp. PR-3]|uniref:head-tail joining protein n=1 Tax=Magnetococcus sp. PR-3 TaxID=3120355 RepID=UPI002FCDF262
MAVDATFQSFGIPATYTPGGGESVAITAMTKRPDEVTAFGDTRIHSETAVFEFRVSEVLSPRSGDQLHVDGVDYLIQGEPVADRDRLVWTLDCYPV